MNRRKAKKKIKKKWNIAKWPGNCPPWLMDTLMKRFVEEWLAEVDRAILYGDVKCEPIGLVYSKERVKE